MSVDSEQYHCDWKPPWVRRHRWHAYFIVVGARIQKRGRNWTRRGARRACAQAVRDLTEVQRAMQPEVTP